MVMLIVLKVKKLRKDAVIILPSLIYLSFVVMFHIRNLSFMFKILFLTQKQSQSFTLKYKVKIKNCIIFHNLITKPNYNCE